jgi:guanidinoacetate N-methyltransferase
MTRKIRRTPNYDLMLEIRSEAFIAPPRAAQRNWLLNKAMFEFAADLESLHQSAAQLVPGNEGHGSSRD